MATPSTGRTREDPGEEDEEDQEESGDEEDDPPSSISPNVRYQLARELAGVALFAPDRLTKLRQARTRLHRGEAVLGIKTPYSTKPSAATGDTPDGGERCHVKESAKTDRQESCHARCVGEAPDRGRSEEEIELIREAVCRMMGRPNERTKREGKC